jgi:two-component system, sensor histidine kinase and response regulator
MLFRVIVIALLTSVCGVCFAQKSEIDSLESLVNSVPSDTNKVWLLNRLVGALREKDNNRALTFAQQAKDLAELLNYTKGLSQALENLGWILYRNADYSKSLDISTQALKVSEEIGDKAAIARCQINIAAIHYEQKQYKEAIRDFKKAHRTAQSVPNYVIMGRCCNNIAYSYIGLNEIDSALAYVQQALALSEKASDPYMTAFARRTLGDIHLINNNTEEALENFNTCLALSKKHNNTFLKASVLHRLGKTYAQVGRYDLALRNLEENLRVAIQYGFKDELERAYITLADTYYKTGDLKRAYQYQSAYIGLHDSLYNQRSSEQIALMQIRFDTELKQAQIELLTKDAALQAEEINKQRIWIYFYVGCLSLLVILAFVLFYNNRHDRKAKLALEEKNKAIETQAQQLRNLNATKDKLFSIISHDLRSPLASLRALMDIVGTSGLTKQEFVDVTRSLKRNLDSVYDDLDNLLLWAQTQLRGLQAFPEEFDLFTLVEDKIKLFNDPASSKGIVFVNTIAPGMFVFADRNHVNLIFRNLLANAVKFNQPGGTISISATERGDYYEINVMDSGIGISLEDIGKLFNAETHFTTPGTNKEKGAGIGLLLTKEFVESNKGSIRVSSQLGKGTSFIFTLRAVRQTVLA